MVDSDQKHEIESLRNRVAELEATLQRLEAEHRLEREHDRLRHQEHALGLIIETEASRDKNRLLSKRLARLRDRLEEATNASDAMERRRRDLRTELDAVYASRAWRTGRRLRSPLRGHES